MTAAHIPRRDAVAACLAVQARGRGLGMGSQNDVVLHKRRVVPRCYGRVLEQHNDRAIGTYLNAIRASLLRRANCAGDVGLMPFTVHYATDALGSGGFGCVQVTSRWSQ